MRKPLAVANWKMNKNRMETLEFAQTLKNNLGMEKKVEVVICPPMVYLGLLATQFADTGYRLGAQNCFWEPSGAYTGEIAPGMLRDISCEYVILGHSERRHIMEETDYIINRKLKAALNAGLIPIFCVGETKEEREQGLADTVVTRQLTQGLSEIELEDAELIIAYEPVWAIGTGINASGYDAEIMACFIRQIIKDMYGYEKAENTRMLYGGSVNLDNIAEFVGEDDIDGALIGGASLQAVTFSNIVRLMEK